MFSTVLASLTLFWYYFLCFILDIYFSRKKIGTNQRKFAVTSVIKIYSKMWELCMHRDYDHWYILLTSK